MKVLFVNDSTTESNVGGRAATVSLRMMIDQLGGEIIKTITIKDLASSSLGDPVEPKSTPRSRPKEVVRLFVPPVATKLRRRLTPRTGGVVEESPIPRDWADYDRCVARVLGADTPWPALLRSFEGVDVAVVFGDGDIYGNGVLPRALLFLSYLLKTRFDKPVIMLNHSADFDDPSLRRVAEEVYPLFDDVVFRDPTSEERCRSMCSGRVAADTAFWFEPAPRETWAQVAGRPTYFDVWPDTASFDPAAPYVCLGGSSIIDTTQDIDDITAGYALLVEELRVSCPGQIVLSASDLVDLPVFRPLAELYDLPLIGVTVPVQQVVDILGNADAYIGGRFHPSVFALRGGTPVIPLTSKTFKMRALVEMAGLSSETFDALDLARHTRAIGDRLAAYLEQGDGLRDRLRSWAGEMAANSWDNLAYLGRPGGAQA